MTNKEAQELFKDNIKSIEIGTHNYCNRTCNFCPLSRDDVNRKEKKTNSDFFDHDVNEFQQKYKKKENYFHSSYC